MAMFRKIPFLEIQDLRPLNTYWKYFETILPNLPLSECEIKESTQWNKVSYIATAVYSKNMIKSID